MRMGRVCCLLAVAALASPSLEASLVDLANSGQWERLLQVANRRSEQLPLQPEEALLAAAAARAVRDREAEIRHLRRAAESGPLAEVARIELAEAVLPADPTGALELAVPLLRSAPTRSIREAAVDVTVGGLAAAAVPIETGPIERAMSSLPQSLRRRVELALAIRDDGRRRQRLVRLLESSTADLVALEASRALGEPRSLTPAEQWLVAESLYRHALYDEVLAILPGLEKAGDHRVPSWEVAFLMGRCAFRQGRWDEAVARYRAAATRTTISERRAELLIHEARAHELAGRLDEAADCAVRAVSTRPSDDRRLFLARLRLRLGQDERASVGIARIRGRSSRARGELLLALADVRARRLDQARSRLEAIRRRPWSGPAAVLAAGLAADAGDSEHSLRLLDGAAGGLDPFWSARARATMERLPSGLVAVWRARCLAEAGAGDAGQRRRALSRWANLEIDREALGSVRQAIAELTGLAAGAAAPAFPPGLAEQLWRWGLRDAAARWDPAGLPADTAAAALWTSQQLVDLGAPWRAIVAADRAWRLAGSELPVRGYPEGLSRALHPLPFPDEIWASAVDSGVPWSLIAGVAREESRWQADVVSGVGARGLMQLMPATAEHVATLKGLPPPTLDELFEPGISLDLGAAELGRLNGVFLGNLAVMAAAYNAGEPQAQIWLDQCGEPCTPELFAAAITFRATARYTKDVLVAAESYAELYGGSPRTGGGSTDRGTPSAAPRGLSGGGSELPPPARSPIPPIARSPR